MPKYPILVLMFFSLMFSCSTAHKTGYTVIPDEKTKVLKGEINENILLKDTAFPWYKENLRNVNVKQSAINQVSAKKEGVTFLVFGGTWCEDTQNLLPIFFTLMHKAGVNDSQITLMGVDRKKKTINDLHTKYQITNVPTFIAIKNGKELGRVVEYGKTGSIDTEIANLL